MSPSTQASWSGVDRMMTGDSALATFGHEVDAELLQELCGSRSPHLDDHDVVWNRHLPAFDGELDLRFIDANDIAREKRSNRAALDRFIDAPANLCTAASECRATVADG